MIVSLMQAIEISIAQELLNFFSFCINRMIYQKLIKCPSLAMVSSKRKPIGRGY